MHPNSEKPRPPRPAGLPPLPAPAGLHAFTFSWLGIIISYNIFLLNLKREANSFIDMKTTVGHVFTIFHEAAGKLSLLLGVDELEKYLNQTSNFHML
jgi:hypothetical protein